MITDEERACSTNFLIAQAPDRMLNVEAAPRSVRALADDDGCLVHTNHLLDPGALGVAEPPSDYRPGSCHRLDRMSALLAAQRPITLEATMARCATTMATPTRSAATLTPAGRMSEHYITVTSVIMDLVARTLYISDGPPCSSLYAADFAFSSGSYYPYVTDFSPAGRKIGNSRETSCCRRLKRT